MSVVAVEVFRASRPAADLMASQGALQRSSEGRILTQLAQSHAWAGDTRLKMGGAIRWRFR